MPQVLPDVSILMPVKNTASFLIDCLDSIICQTIVEWELIAVDDGSEDESLDILREYGLKDKRIQVYQNPNKGIITALRLAYEKSSGAYITRMDSDDKMTECKLELMHNALIEKGEGALAVGLVEYFSAKELGNGYARYAAWLNKVTLSETNFSEIYKECSIPSPCWMVTRADLDRCGAFDADIYPEDYDLAFRMKKINLEICGIGHVLHHWRDYPMRTSRTDKNYADNSFAALKVKHFVDQDYRAENTLVIWGGGDKGKALARLFNQEGIPFRWICNNPKKIGQNIYGVILEEEAVLTTLKSAQVIVSFVHEDAELSNNKIFSQYEQHQLFRFC